MSDTPQTTVTPSRFGPEWDRKMAELVNEHNNGQHGAKNRPTGCPDACPGWLLTQIRVEPSK